MSTDSDDSIKKSNVLLSILDSINDEISYYRQRQITTFREVAIVLALITWGVGHLGIELDDSQSQGIRLIACFACILVTYLGYKMIRNFRERIHFVRKRRDKIEADTFTLIGMQSVGIFFPIPVKKQETDNDKNMDAKRIAPSSNIYIAALITVGFITAALNLFLALSYCFE
ncbi:hypothetical protein KKC97_12320 [bacterium]|nr:hypothetical protein [bacterium]